MGAGQPRVGVAIPVLRDGTGACSNDGSNRREAGGPTEDRPAAKMMRGRHPLPARVQFMQTLGALRIPERRSSTIPSKCRFPVRERFDGGCGQEGLIVGSRRETRGLGIARRGSPPVKQACCGHVAKRKLLVPTSEQEFHQLR